MMVCNCNANCNETIDELTKDRDLWKSKAEALAEALRDILTNYDEAKDDCGICDKGIFGGHTKYCIVPMVQESLSAFDGKETK